ncbi:MAG: hypothetical protein LC746_00965 [Acidobacteria bacterium]|nr:hypothetical protein [Acidobacteriota bacterium]
MIRALALSLIILATLAATLPAGDALVEAARRANATEQRRPRRRHTRAWWRRHRAHLRRQRALAADRRRRRWALRRRPAVSLRREETPRVTLPELLKPTMELPSASPSSLASVAVIEAEIGDAPAPRAAAQALPPAPTQTAHKAAPSKQQPPAQKSQPASVKSQAAAVTTTQPAATPQLAHAPQPSKPAPQTAATKANAPAATPDNFAALHFAAANNLTPPNASARAATTPGAARQSLPQAAKPTPSIKHAASSNATSATNAASSTKTAPASKPAPVLSARALSPLTNLLVGTPLANAPLVGTTPPRVAASASLPNAGATPAREPRGFTALPVPGNWLSVSSSLGGEYKFSLRAPDGRASGVAVWSRVNLPAATLSDKRNRSLAGVAHAALRRTVIDRMLVEGGWVVNDFERQIAGQRVFCVVAQSETPAGARRNWTYYFVASDGQLFSLATTTPAEFADSVAAEAEQTLAALAARRAAQQ